MTVFLIFYLIVYLNLILYEEEKLEQIFGEEFRKYKREVPRLIPNFKKVNFRGGYDFSLAMREHKEWQTWLGILVVFVVILIKVKWELYL